jgi:hypothetical protein
MDVAYYLSELLGQIGEVNVPGLGSFAQTRLDGYYDNQDATFYPPGHKIDFHQQFLDDDVLAKYIAQKKNISLASSKYFTEKYINTLKQDALLRDVPLADLGWLHMEQSMVIFKPADALANDPAFYGFPNIKLEKTGSPTYTEPVTEPEPVSFVYPETIVPENAVPDPFLYEHVPPVPVIEEKAAEIVPEPYIPPVIPEPVKEEIVAAEPVLPVPILPAPALPEPEHYPEVSTGPLTDTNEEFIFRGRGYDEVEEKKKNWWGIILISLAIVIVIALAGLAALYKFKPDTFNRITGVVPKPVMLVRPSKTDTIKTVIPVVKADTGKKDTAKEATSVDTTAKAAVVPLNNAPASSIDSTKKRFELIGAEAKTANEASQDIKNFKSIGLNDAHVVTDAAGKRLKISLGTYSTYSEAIHNREELIKSGKVKDPWPLPINPKQ